MPQHTCYGCEENLGNQQAHFGGCIPDPYFYEDDIFNNNILAANTLLAIKNERSLHETYENALNNGHFVATKLPFSYFSWANGICVDEDNKVITELRNDWGVNVNGGDWILQFTMCLMILPKQVHITSIGITFIKYPKNTFIF